MNTITWAPWEYGLILAAGSADGKITIISIKGDDSWSHTEQFTHDGAVNSISWGPSTEPSMLSQEHATSQIDQQQFTLPPKRFVSGGCDGYVKFWAFKDNRFVEIHSILAHDDWVRDVAWCNNIGLMHDTVASCSEDHKVKIWRKQN